MNKTQRYIYSEFISKSKEQEGYMNTINHKDYSLRLIICMIEMSDLVISCFEGIIAFPKVKQEFTEAFAPILEGFS